MNGSTSKAVFFLMAGIFAIGVADLCPELYLRYSTKHTYCLPSNASCEILESGVSPEDVEVILREHNLLRNKVSMGEETLIPLPTAANMLQLIWHNELAEVAQKHANQCNMEHDCSQCRKIEDFNVGQNLYEYVSDSKEPLKPNWTAAIHEWYNEVKYFDPSRLSSYEVAEPSEEYGHFTQLIWASTEFIGCGYVRYQSGKFQHQLYTCNYGPDGNILQQPLYEVGAQCSSCPTYFSCDDLPNDEEETYTGLCRYTGRELFVSPEVNNIFSSNFLNPSGLIEKSDKWKVTTTLRDSYMSIVLKGGESSTMDFAETFKGNAERMCLSMYYRKGPNQDGKEAANEAYISLNIAGSDEIVVPLTDNPNTFAKFSINLGWPSETKMSVGFSVPPDKPEQYLDIKDIQVKNGPC